MEGKKIRAIGTSLILCLAAMNISGCGLKDSESSANAVMGRVTSVSDTQIVMEVMDKQDDKKPEAASGGAAGIEGNKPQGTPPAGMQQDNDGQKPEGTPPADNKDAKNGEKPQGTPPADAKNGGKKKGESKTYQIDSDTKIYKKSGEESTEISVSEINPGDMVSVETDGEKATSITVSDMSAMGQPGQNSQDTSSGK